MKILEYKKRDPARLFLKRLGLVVLFVAVLGMASGVWSVYQKERESRMLRTQAEREYADLEKREAALQADLANLQTDRGVEAALRTQYALASSGEGVIVIVEPRPVPPATTTTPSGIERWFEKIFSWW